MSLQPKNRKYRLSFRNKTQIYNNLPKDVRTRKLKNKFCYKTNTIFKEVIHHENRKALLNKAHSLTLSHGLPASTNFQISQISILKNNRNNFCNLANSNTGTRFLFNSKMKTELKVTSKQLDSILTTSQKSLNTNRTSVVFDKIKFGSCGFYFCSSGTISSKFIETIRLIIARKLKKLGRYWIRVSPDTPVTARSAETRMGRGKGAINHYEAKIRPGQIFIEFSGVPEESVKQIYQQIAKKTAIPIKFI